MNLAGMRSCAGANSCWWPLDLLSSFVRLLRAFALCRRAMAHICPPAECPKRLTCTFNLTSAISVFVNHMFNMLGFHQNQLDELHNDCLMVSAAIVRLPNLCET